MDIGVINRGGEGQFTFTPNLRAARRPIVMLHDAHVPPSVAAMPKGIWWTAVAQVVSRIRWLIPNNPPMVPRIFNGTAKYLYVHGFLMYTYERNTRHGCKYYYTTQLQHNLRIYSSLVFT